MTSAPNRARSNREEAVAINSMPQQAVANGTFSVCHHPAAGPIRQVEPPARFGGTPSTAGGPAALPGQHTDEILREVGYDDDAIRALRDSGVAL